MFIYKMGFVHCWSGFEIKRTTCTHFLCAFLFVHLTKSKYFAYLPATAIIWMIQSPKEMEEEKEREREGKRPAVSISVNVNIYTSCSWKTISYMHFSWFDFVRSAQELKMWFYYFNTEYVINPEIVCILILFLFQFLFLFWVRSLILICCIPFSSTYSSIVTFE